MNPSGSKFSFPWRSKGKPKEPTDSVQSPGSSLTGLRPFIPTSDIPEIERWRILILRRKGFIHAEAEKGKRKTKASSGTEDVSRRPSLRMGTVNPPPAGLLDTKTTQQSPPLQINTGKKSPLGGDTSNDADQSISAPFQPMRYEEGSRAEPVIPSHEGSDSLLEMYPYDYTDLLDTDESESAHSLVSRQIPMGHCRSSIGYADLGIDSFHTIVTAGFRRTDYPRGKHYTRTSRWVLENQQRSHQRWERALSRRR
jgi:hypothetical protein